MSIKPFQRRLHQTNVIKQRNQNSRIP
jgi:hypothetical protein